MVIYTSLQIYHTSVKSLDYNAVPAFCAIVLVWVDANGASKVFIGPVVAQAKVGSSGRLLLSLGGGKWPFIWGIRARVTDTCGCLGIHLNSRLSCRSVYRFVARYKIMCCGSNILWLPTMRAHRTLMKSTIWSAEDNLRLFRCGELIGTIVPILNFDAPPPLRVRGIPAAFRASLHK